MATIKSFTDLSQSKILSKILPLDSADMCCFQNQNGDINYYGFPFLQGNKDCNPIPCWSLAALLDILAKQSFKISSLEYKHEYQYNIDVPCRHCQIWFSSLLDAAYEMILALHELKML